MRIGDFRNAGEPDADGLIGTVAATSFQVNNCFAVRPNSFHRIDPDGRPSVVTKGPIDPAALLIDQIFLDGPD